MVPLLGSPAAPSEHPCLDDTEIIWLPATIALHMTYNELPQQEETSRAYKRRVYNTLRTMSLAKNMTRAIRVTLLKPSTKWPSVWRNLHLMPVTEEAKSTWYMVIHDLVSINLRLHTVRLTESDLCKIFRRQDTLIHRLTECGDGSVILEWTRRRIAWMLRTNPRKYTQTGSLALISRYDRLIDTWRFCGP